MPFLIDTSVLGRLANVHRQAGSRRAIGGRLPRACGDASADVQHGPLRAAGHVWTGDRGRRSRGGVTAALEQVMTTRAGQQVQTAPKAVPAFVINARAASARGTTAQPSDLPHTRQNPSRDRAPAAFALNTSAFAPACEPTAAGSTMASTRGILTSTPIAAAPVSVQQVSILRAAASRSDCAAS